VRPLGFGHRPEKDKDLDLDVVLSSGGLLLVNYDPLDFAVLTALLCYLEIERETSNNGSYIFVSFPGLISELMGPSGGAQWVTLMWTAPPT
jgi:hypothetical protein